MMPRKKAKEAPPVAANKGGRPPIAINWTVLDALLAVQGTLEECASYFECSVDTIERAVEREHGMGFAEYRDQKKGKGLISLRRKQFALALGGNVTMLIWLGKQLLNQADKAELTGANGGPVKTQEIPQDEDERADRAASLIRRAEMRRRGVV